VERADQVLARGGVDRRLAADARIDLGEQRGRQLDEAAAALEDRRGKADEVADHPAAERQHVIAALDFLGQQPVDHKLEHGPRLGAFARLEHQPARLEPGPGQRAFDRVLPVSGDVAVGHHRHAPLAQQGAALGGQVGQQPAADPHLVGAAGQFDRDHSHSSSSCRMRAIAAL
jgi:hypothetical protein